MQNKTPCPTFVDCRIQQFDGEEMCMARWIPTNSRTWVFGLYIKEDSRHKDLRSRYRFDPDELYPGLENPESWARYRMETTDYLRAAFEVFYPEFTHLDYGFAQHLLSIPVYLAEGLDAYSLSNSSIERARKLLRFDADEIEKRGKTFVAKVHHLDDFVSFGLRWADRLRSPGLYLGQFARYVGSQPTSFELHFAVEKETRDRKTS